MFYELPITNDPRQVMTADMIINDVLMHLKIEIRYLPAPNEWVISVWDNSSGELLVNQIKLVCSYELVNDLFVEFQDIENIGSLIVVRNVDEPSTMDPAEGNLKEFRIIMGDTYGERNADVSGDS